MMFLDGSRRSTRTTIFSRVRASSTNRLGGEVEVVVVQHDPRRTVAARNLRQHRAGKRAVELYVALAPGAHGGRTDHWALRKVPQLMLQEPEQRIGDDVIGA